jgi:hypothetical protein
VEVFDGMDIDPVPFGIAEVLAANIDIDFLIV